MNSGTYARLSVDHAEPQQGTTCLYMYLYVVSCISLLVCDVYLYLHVMQICQGSYVRVPVDHAEPQQGTTLYLHAMYVCTHM